MKMVNGSAAQGACGPQATTKAQRAALAARELSQAGIPFTVHNGGAHLVVEGPVGFIDYWPTTGKWAARSGRKGFGLLGLLKHVRGEVDE